MSDGSVEMKVSAKKSASFYIRALRSFLQGREQRPAEEGRAAVEAREPVDKLRISGLGEAINAAVAAASCVEAEGICRICSIRTVCLQLEGSQRSCPQII